MARAAKSRRRVARDLVHARRHAPVRAARRRPHADADGQVQGAALRRQGRSRRSSSPPPACRRRCCSPRSTGTTSSTSAWAPSRAPTARWRSPARWATQAARHRRRGHRRSAYGIFKAGRGALGKTIGIAGEHLTGDEMAAACTRRWASRCATTTVDPGGLPRLRVPRRRRPGQHVPVQARLQRRVLRGARPEEGARAQPCHADFRAMARSRTPGGFRSSRRSSAARPLDRGRPGLGAVLRARRVRRVRHLHRRAVLRLVRKAPGVGLRRPSPAGALRAPGRAGVVRRLDRRLAGAGGDLWRAGRLPHRMALRPARCVTLRTGDGVRGGRVGAAVASAVWVLLDERHRAGVVAGPGRHAPRDRTPRRCALVAAVRRAVGCGAADQAHRDHLRRGAWCRPGGDPARRHLRSPWLWVGAAVAVAMAVPNALWQHAHGWPSLEFYRNAALYKNNPASATRS